MISSLPRILDLAPCARAALLALCLKGGLRTPALGSTDAFHYPSIWKMPVKSKLHTCLKTSVKMYIYIYISFLSTYMYVSALRDLLPAFRPCPNQRYHGWHQRCFRLGEIDCGFC